MTSTGAPLLSWGWLSHPGDELEHVLLLSARPALDCLRDMRRLDAFTPRQVRHRARQLQHPVTLALALQVPVYARALRFIARPQPLHGRAQELRCGGRSRPPGSGRAPASDPTARCAGEVSALVVRPAPSASPSRWRSGPIVTLAPPPPVPGSCRTSSADGSPRRSLSMRSTRAFGTARAAPLRGGK